MMAEVVDGTLEDTLLELDEFTDWSAAMVAAQEYNDTVIPENVDRIPIDVAEAILDKAEAQEDEVQSRADLQRAVADESFDGLDTISKLSVLHMLSRVSWDRGDRASQYGSGYYLRGGIDPRHLTVAAHQIATTVRTVDDLLRSTQSRRDPEVVVTEHIRAPHKYDAPSGMEALRNRSRIGQLRDAGYYSEDRHGGPGAYIQMVTRGVVTDVDRALPLFVPSPDEVVEQGVVMNPALLEVPYDTRGAKSFLPEPELATPRLMEFRKHGANTTLEVVQKHDVPLGLMIHRVHLSGLADMLGIEFASIAREANDVSEWELLKYQVEIDGTTVDLYESPKSDVS